MGYSYSFEDANYSIQATETDAHIDLKLRFKKPKPAPPPIEQQGSRAARVIVPANVHQRREGIPADDMLVLAADEHTFEVSSRSEPGAFHIVLIDGEQEVCDCTAACYGRLCRHVKGVRTLLGRDTDAPLRSRNGVVPQAPDYGLPITLTGEPSD